MQTITLQTFIRSDIEKCFDVARSPSFHLKSTEHTKERVVQGEPDKLLELGDTITWEAIHFFVRQRLRVKITEYERPHFFTDQMISGAFKFMKHNHQFTLVEGGTMMEDEFCFESPLGLLGRLVDKVVLKNYMTRFLKIRNATLKKELELDELL